MEEVLRHYEKTAPDRRRLILARRIVESKWELEEIVTRGEDAVIFIVLDVGWFSYFSESYLAVPNLSLRLLTRMFLRSGLYSTHW